MILLCDLGFSIDAERAARVLHWFAHRFPSEHIVKVVSGCDYSMNALGAAKGIASAAAKGMPLPDSARRDALIVFERMHAIDETTRDALLAKGKTLEPGARALLEISGYGRQDSFFRRMNSLAPARAAMAGYENLDSARWELYLDFFVEVRALVDDVKHAFAENFASPSWLSDPDEFRDVFGVSDDEMGWPWWTCEGAAGSPTPDVKARPGFAGLRESEGLRRVADPAFRVYAEDMATPDYGIGPDGTRSERLGNHVVTLAVVSSRKATLTSLDTADPKARRKRGVPKAALVDETAKALAEELIEAEADIALLLLEARARLQTAWRRDRVWRLTDWRERFLDNGLVATLTRRLIWRFETEKGAIDGIPRADGTILNVEGDLSPLPGSEATVRLWHPLAQSAEEVAAWRARLRASEIRQPFAQAWRAHYVLTDAERKTRTYSNRFAGHILHQPPLIAILRKRG